MGGWWLPHRNLDGLDLNPDRYIVPLMPAKVRPGSQEAFEEIKEKTAIVNKNLRFV